VIAFGNCLRSWLRQARSGGRVPIRTEATAMISAYLTAERLRP
jgi:hypothetical protein